MQLRMAFLASKVEHHHDLRLAALRHAGFDPGAALE
jgi:hypothetical protein